jgi:hypothetical protein
MQFEFLPIAAFFFLVTAIIPSVKSEIHPLTKEVFAGVMKYFNKLVEQTPAIQEQDPGAYPVIVFSIMNGGCSFGQATMECMLNTGDKKAEQKLKDFSAKLEEAQPQVESLEDLPGVVADVDNIMQHMIGGTNFIKEKGLPVEKCYAARTDPIPSLVCSKVIGTYFSR